VLIRVSDPDLVTDLRDHLRMVGCIAAKVGPDLLRVTVPDATDAQEGREVRAYVKTWTAARGADAEVIDE
jgi:hypothetical protein